MNEESCERRNRPRKATAILDNRPSGEAPRTYTANGYLVYDELGRVTGAEAIYTLSVSMQPGNNYRAGASCLEDAIDQADQALADLRNLEPNCGGWSGYSTPLTWSPMLTVWRKLHVEVAAMQRPMFSENTLTGNWNSAATFTAPGGGQIRDRIILQVDDLPIDNNQLEQGWIQIAGPGLAGLESFRVFESSDGFLEDTITVIVPDDISVLQGVTNGTFVVSDDDIQDQALFDLGIALPASPQSYGADVHRGLLPLGPTLPYPDTNGLDVLYAPAYILPVVDSINTGVIAFEQHLPGIFTDGYFDQFIAVRSAANPRSIASFWTVMVGSGFQANRSQDGDPETEVTKGACPHAVGSTDAGSRTGVCVIFVETADDVGGVDDTRIIAHEIAHTLGSPHFNGGGGLMETHPVGRPVFQPPALKRLREYVEP